MAKSINVPIPTPEEIEKFWDKVFKFGEHKCWLWMGAQNNNYGAFRFRGKLRRAHRLAYVWEYGELSEGYDGLDHICNNKLCVNPQHLRPSLAIENVLRGKGLTAQNSKKEKCPKGHELDYDDPRGWRGCSICRVEAVNKYRDENHEKINKRRREIRKRVTYESQICGAEDCYNKFIPKRKDTRFCSSACQQRERLRNLRQSE